MLQLPVVNLGMIGHVDHGKTTLTESLSGIWTDRHSEELRRGVSIRLGYADAVFRKCTSCNVHVTEKKCPNCGKETDPLRRVSFVDAPGHESLMATMLSGAFLMDGAVLVIAADEPCPQPQTKEHLMGLEIIGVSDIVVAQNKIELVSKKEVKENYRQIRKFLKKGGFIDTPVIPVSAVHKVNLDKLIEAVEEIIPTKEREVSKPPRMHIARSFDVNRPGTSPKDLKGGVVGGTLLRGRWEIGDKIEIRPGIQIKEGGKKYWEPLRSEIVSLRMGNRPVDEATPGGLVGIGTKLDPSYTRADSLAGTVGGEPGSLPPVLDEILLRINLLGRIVGLKREKKVESIRTHEQLMLNVGTSSTVGSVTSVRDSEAEIDLRLPVCAEEGNRTTINRRIKGRWRLIGYGIIS